MENIGLIAYDGEMKRTGPCLDKNCAECCDPVKVRRFQLDELPKDAEGKPIWKQRSEMLIPEDAEEHTKLEAYDCKNFDPVSGKCLDYENRPEICKDSGCVNPKSTEPVEEQFRKMKEKKFIKIR